MELPIQITQKLKVYDVCSLYTQDKNRKAVIFHFTFYGEDCTAVMDAEDAEKGSYSTWEASSDISDSFETAIEENFQQIKEIYKEHIQEEEF